MGRASYEWNDLETAQFHFLAGASLRHAANAVSIHDCLIGLALTYAAQGLWQRADETADTLVSFDSDPPAFQLLMQAYSLRARLALASGNLHSARRWLLSSEAEPYLSPTPLGETTVVTRSRVFLALKTHEGAQEALDLARLLQQDAISISSNLRVVQALAVAGAGAGRSKRSARCPRQFERMRLNWRNRAACYAPLSISARPLANCCRNCRSPDSSRSKQR